MTERPGLARAESAKGEVRVSSERARPAFSSDLRREFRRLFTRPYDDVLTIISNGALVCFFWFVIPASTRDNMFALPASLAFAVVLESWMLSDVPATNVLAKDPDRSVAVLADRERLKQLLRAKAVALATLVAPLCAAIAVLLSSLNGRAADGIALATALLVLPFATASVSPSLGIRWPYHPRPLRWRWVNRRPWRRTFRWITLIFAPYIYVPMLAAVALAPGLLIGFAVGGYDDDHHVSTAGLVTTTCLVIALSAVVFALGARMMAALVARRKDALTAYLNDPERG